MPWAFTTSAIRETGQFIHATAIMIVTPQGKIAQYYYGVEFSPKDVRLGLIEASRNKIGNSGRPGRAVLLSLRPEHRAIRRRRHQHHALERSGHRFCYSVASSS